MTRPKLPTYLEDLNAAIDDALFFVRGYEREGFLADAKTQAAVQFELTLIGEIVAAILRHHEDFAEAHDDVPWEDIRGMRNHLVHQYFDTDLSILWNTLQTALPALRAQMPALMESAQAFTSSPKGPS